MATLSMPSLRVATNPKPIGQAVPLSDYGRKNPPDASPGDFLWLGPLYLPEFGFKFGEGDRTTREALDAVVGFLALTVQHRHAGFSVTRAGETGLGDHRLDLRQVGGA